MKRLMLLIIAVTLLLIETGTIIAQERQLPSGYKISCEFLPDHANYSVYTVPNNSFMRGQTIFNLKEASLRYHQGYINKRKTGKSSRGFELPAEKPILEITAEEIGTYKDKFVLNDRVWLFMIWLWDKMGKSDYDAFLQELINMNSIDYDSFEKLVLKYIPGSREDLRLWLKTTGYPERFYPDN